MPRWRFVSKSQFAARKQTHQDQPLATELTTAVAQLGALLAPCGDFETRSFTLETDPPVRAAVAYCKSLVDENLLNMRMLQAQMLEPAPVEAAGSIGATGGPRSAATVQDAAMEILNGSLALLTDGCAGAMMVETKSRLGRSVAEPTSEGVVRGPREGFIEALTANITLLRRRLPVLEFRVEKKRIGRRTRTAVAIVYLQGVAADDVVAEVRRRLDHIQIDGVLDSAYIEELIEDHPLSPFPTIDHTERPDKVAAALLEGRVAILTANSPAVLIVPSALPQFLQASEDYYERYFLASILRPIRYLAFFLTLTLPAFYVAVTTFHHEMIPSTLFVALAAQREGVPWPAIVEALLMEVTFELLREAGIRLPRPVGQAISIIGGVVIGEAAVRARIASAGMVIVVATTGIASFAIPAYSFAVSLRLLRFLLMILAANLGVIGLVVGLVVIFIHVSGLRSFGVHYLSPISPAAPGDWKDVLWRAPWWKMRRRPVSLGAEERLPPGQMPGEER